MPRSRALFRHAAAALIVLLLGGFLLAACGGASSAIGAASSCAGPTLTASPETAAPGDKVVIEGRYFVDDCGDTSTSSPAVASRGVPLTLAPVGSARVALGSFDAEGELGTIAATVTLPSSLRVGQARLQLGDARPVDMTISASGG